MREDATAVMRAPVISIHPSETLKAAMERIVDRGIGALPVGEDGRVSGFSRKVTWRNRAEDGR